MAKVTVADLRAALADWRDDAEVCVAFASTTEVGIMAVVPENEDALAGRIATEDNAIVIVRRI